MQPGTYRKAAAVGILAVCLWLAAPTTADARLLEPSHHEVAVQTELREEAGLWQRVWEAIWSVVWDRQSVLIDPNG